MSQPVQIILAVMLCVWTNVVHATTVRHIYDLSNQDNENEYRLLYTHELWDADFFGFSFICDKKHAAHIDIYYNLYSQRTLQSLQRLKRKPRLIIRSKLGRATVVGEIEERDADTLMHFALLNTEDTRELLKQSDVVLAFPDNSFSIWRIKGSHHIEQFLESCRGDSSRSNASKPLPQKLYYGSRVGEPLNNLSNAAYWFR